MTNYILFLITIN